MNPAPHRRHHRRASNACVRGDDHALERRERPAKRKRSPATGSSSLRRLARCAIRQRADAHRSSSPRLSVGRWQGSPSRADRGNSSHRYARSARRRSSAREPCSLLRMEGAGRASAARTHAHAFPTIIATLETVPPQRSPLFVGHCRATRPESGGRGRRDRSRTSPRRPCSRRHGPER